jgi:protein-disulfide isomerase
MPLGSNMAMPLIVVFLFTDLQCKNVLKDFFETTIPKAWIFGKHFHLVVLYKIDINHAPWVKTGLP